MQSKELLRMTLEMTRGIVLPLIEDMKDAPVTFPTPNGGCHPLWVLGNATLSEARFVREWIVGEPNPLAEWNAIFGAGTEPVADPATYPPFDEVMAKSHAVREGTLKLLDSFSEADLDKTSKAPAQRQANFGTVRQCFLMTALHWMMHRGQVADARRAAGRKRIGP
ncbi:MAG: DinB family protein [Candidatus Methylomirabilales bacterium]